MRTTTIAPRDLAYAVGAGIALPVLAVALLVWGLGNRTSSADTIPLAIVNNDKPITGNNPVAAGRALAASLTDPPSSAQVSLGWTLTDSGDAESGLRNGTYYSVLTIPSNFSKSVSSTGTDKPVQAQVTLESNAAASATVGVISQQVAQAAVSSLGVQVTQNFVGNTLDGLNQEAKSLGDAATNAASLASGTSSLSSGAQKLTKSSQQLASGTDQLASGTASLAGDSATLAGGANQVASGVDRLASAVDSVGAKASGLSSGAHRTHRSARSAVNRTNRAADAAARARSAASRLESRADRTDSGATSLSAVLRLLDRRCATASTQPAFCADLHRATRQSGRVAQDAASVKSRVSTVESSARKAQSDAAAARAAAGRVADRTDQLEATARSLAGQAGAAKTSVNQLAAGADSVATGATALNQGAGQLSTAAGQTAAGADSLASGNAQLASSAKQVDQGAQSLSTGLANGAKKAPSYTSSQQKQLTKVASQPVVMHAKSQHDTVQNAWLTGAIVGVVLWFGAFAVLFLRPRLATSAGRLGPVSSTRLAMIQLVPRLVLALAQALLVFVVLLLLGQHLASALAFGAFTVLGAVVFALVVEALHVGLRRAATIGFLLLSAIQLAALGNVVPIQTAPGALQTLNHLLPLTTFVNGAAQFASGGHVFSVAALVITLVLWGLVALAVILFRTRRDRSHVRTTTELTGFYPVPRT
jgi:putative membrane protein